MYRPSLEHVDLIITGYVAGYYDNAHHCDLANQTVDKRLLKQSCLETVCEFMGITYMDGYYVLGIDTADYVDQEINRLEGRTASVR